MRKQIYYCLCIGFIMLGGIGCATEQTDGKATPSPTKNISPFTSAKKEETLILEGLQEVLENKDASKEASYNSFHRMASIFVDDTIGNCSLFCIDSDTGVVYFANKGKDGYLYRIKEGEVELAVAMPVKEIYTYDGLVYFMIENYEKYELNGMNEGDIYCYTPKNGTVELIYAAGDKEGSKEHKLMVNKEGIYFSYHIYKDNNSSRKYSYYLPFGETEPIIDKNSMTEPGWGNYYFSNSGFDLQLLNRTDSNDVKEISAGTLGYCVVGDNLYSIKVGSTILSCFNLKTGEQTEYDFVEVVEQTYIDKDGNSNFTEHTMILQSFIVMEDEIWVAASANLYHLDLESGEMNYYSLIDEVGQERKYYDIKSLYTDGEQLYATVCPLGEMEESFHRILTEEVVKDMLGVCSFKVEPLVK